MSRRKYIESFCGNYKAMRTFCDRHQDRENLCGGIRRWGQIVEEITHELLIEVSTLQYIVIKCVLNILKCAVCNIYVYILRPCWNIISC